jgi:NADPH2:quinone reductase
VPVPEGVATDVAAASILQGITALYLAEESYPIQKGDWVIVHAAAGGVGQLLTQIAKMLGGRVLATTSSEEKARLAREAGADEVVGYEAFGERARELTGGEGVAAVYDGVGEATFEAGLRAIRPFGRMILYGAASGQPAPFTLPRLAGLGSLYVQRPTLQTYTRTAAMLRQRAGRLFELIAEGRLKVRIGGRYQLKEARQAHIDLQSRKTTGKLLLIP